jgi:hypothetical protein
MTSVRFLIAAACMALGPSLGAANLFPTSPLIQLGNDTDIFFDSSFALDITDNLYTTANAVSATSWTVTPGLALEYGKDSAFAVNFSARRNIVRYNKASLADLEDDRDALSASIRADDGGPLSLSLDSSYRITVRNDDLAQQGVGTVIPLGANLLRQSNYSHAFEAKYKLTEKINVTLGFTNTYNHYLNPVKTVEPSQTEILPATTPATFQTGNKTSYNTNGLTELNTKAIPLEVIYQAFEKLSFGLRYQHDITDYSPAPYFFQDTSSANPTQVSTQRLAGTYPLQMRKHFYGLTAKGDPTGAGKLNVTARAGYATSSVDGAANEQIPSFSINLQHTLTEKVNHSLALSRDINANNTGGQIDSKSYTYTVNFTAAEDLSFNLGATKSDVLAGTTVVNTMVYNLGADYKYNPHLSFTLAYSFTDSKLPGNAAANFQANALTISGAFRY